MYVITGGAGFIGSAFARKLNQEGIDDIVIVDELKSSENWKNLRKISFIDYLHKDDFIAKIKTRSKDMSFKAIIHMGACSSTTETDADYMLRNNYSYTRTLAEYAIEEGIRFIYASSGATYGDGSSGYSDNEQQLDYLKPLNIYGYSKHLFDLYARKKGYLKNICGLKFFNVFGPNEYHKADMRSVALKSYLQIKQEGAVKLFKSYQQNFKDGEQKRDFIYVKDCIEVMWWLLNNNTPGLFNLGTGNARSWNDLVRAVFAALQIEAKINYIEMPESLRKQYQYFTQADMEKLGSAGYKKGFHSLEDAVKDYIAGYLEQPDGYL